MKKSLVFIIISLAFLCAGVNATAQDTKNPDPRYLLLDEHPTFKGGSPNDFALWVARHVKYPKYAKETGIEGIVKVHFVIDKKGRVVYNAAGYDEVIAREINEAITAALR